jgi:hypothetical protein
MPLILSLNPITTAMTALVGSVFDLEPGPNRDLLLEAVFAYGSSGTSVDAWVQTTVDQGATWIDIANFHFTTSALKKLFNLSSATPITSQATPGDGVLSANTAVDGIIGGQLRVKYTTVGTYAGATSLGIYAAGARLRAP